MKKTWIALALMLAVLATAWLSAVDIFALDGTSAVFASGSEPAAKEPENPPVEESQNPPANEPENPPANELENPPANEPENPPANEPENPPANEPENPPANEPENLPMNDPENPPANELENPPANEPENPPMNDPENPLVEETESPDVEETAEPSAGPSAKPTAILESSATPVPEKLVISLTADKSFAFAGETVHTTLSVRGGVPEYSVNFSVYGEKNAATIDGNGQARFDFVPDGYGNYSVQATVMDGSGQTAQAYVDVIAAERGNETEQDWIRSVQGASLTGDWRRDLVAIAATQVGYTASEKCFLIDEAGERHNYSRYGDWYGAPYSDWCAMFVAFCAHYAQIPESAFPTSASCGTWKGYLQNMNAYMEAESGYQPKSGDLIFFNPNGKSTPSHMGIVERADAGTVYTIEGNVGGVRRKEYALSSGSIIGYGSMEAIMLRAGKLTAQAIPETEPTVSPENTPTAALEITAPPEAANEEPAFIPFETERIGYTTAGTVNLREGAGTDTRCVAQISPRGSEVSVLGTIQNGDELWYAVRDGEFEGYIFSTLLRLEDVTEETPEPTEGLLETQTPEPEETPKAEETPEPETTQIPKPTESPEAAPSAEPDDALTVEDTYNPLEGLIAYTAKDAVLIRAEASENSDCIGRIDDKNTQVIVLSISDNGLWIQVQYGAQRGYIYASLLRITDEWIDSIPTPEEQGCEIGYTATNIVSLYAKPSEQADSSTLWKKGIQLIIVGREENSLGLWYAVLFGDRVLYAKASDITLASEIEPTATPTIEPTATPTIEPTATPTIEPTATPTIEPTATPTIEPTATPTIEPTATPTIEPTAIPVYYCNLEEHAHGVECFDEHGLFICRLPEHVHSDACLIQPTVQPTIEPAATPDGQNAALSGETDDAPEMAYVCGKAEHVHTEACYDEGGTLICLLEEHRHDESCRAVMLTAEEQAQVDETIAMIDALPALDEIEAGISGYREAKDEEGLKNWLAEMKARIQSALQSYDALTDLQKEQVPEIKDVRNLEQLLEGLMEELTVAGRAPVLTDDSAYVSELEATGIEVVKEDGAAAEDAMTVRNGETVQYGFRVRTASYTDEGFGEGRVRLEFVLPLSGEKAAFDLSDVAWLDGSEGYAPVIETQTRTIDGNSMLCQVLTGYKLLYSEEAEASVIPGEFTQTVPVKVLSMENGETVALLISAAMEYGVWEGVCETHMAEEKLTVATESCTVSTALTPEEQQANYERYLAEVEALESIGELDELSVQEAEALLERIREAFERGELSQEGFEALYGRVFILLYGDPNTIAEAAKGSNWMSLRDSGWFQKYSGSAVSTAKARQAAAVMMASLPLDDGEYAAQPSDVQVDNRGGTNATDDGSVSVSKTIAGTELENVFDITLQVQTSVKVSEIVEEPDMAVVIVMDISNTMNSNFGGVTRYAAAMTAAENFLDQFAANNSLGISKVGYVAFNTDAHQIFGLQSCSTAEQANALKNTMRTQTGSIINASGYNESHSRFTNVEAGLAMASDMLNGVSNENKFIIFLSDGFPTTYIRSGYSGYDPYDSTGRFYDHVLNKPCLYGTSYSDEAAIRARNKAAAIKATGTTIFSIGVDVAGQTIQEYITQSEEADGFSVVDRTGTTYEIGDASSTEAYKSWLRNSIGSGYYYDSTNSAGLTSAYTQIFEEIKHSVEIGSVADWVASDPLPSIDGSMETVEFIGFYNKTPELVSGDLTGEHEAGGENTAAFDAENATISWDLKESGYQETSSGTTTTYVYQLVYRVRLKNETGSFAEGTIYPTNDTTSLQYRTIEGTDGNLTVSDPKTIEFPIPSVHGYLAELRFTKIDTQGGAVPGAEFTLNHDTSQCEICRGDGTSVSVAPQVQTSAEDGIVAFTGIPSGHIYTLQETKIPDGYIANGNTYMIEVAYDEVTVTVKDANGNSVDWRGQYPNQKYYELPDTGGTGPLLYTAGGLLLTAASAFLLYIHIRRRKEDIQSS